MIPDPSVGEGLACETNYSSRLTAIRVKRAKRTLDVAQVVGKMEDQGDLCVSLIRLGGV